jgi:hypothetical protein
VIWTWVGKGRAGNGLRASEYLAFGSAKHPIREIIGQLQSRQRPKTFADLLEVPQFTDRVRGFRGRRGERRPESARGFGTLLGRQFAVEKCADPIWRRLGIHGRSVGWRAERA